MSCCGDFMMPFEENPTRRRPAPPSREPQPLSGRGVLVYLSLFFGAMALANGALVYSALRSLPGGALANSYDASQSYNKSIAEARAQDERGWRASVSARPEGDGARVVFELRERDGTPVGNANVEARFEHPSDRRVDRAASLTQSGATHEGLVRDLRPGQWTLVIEARTVGETAFVTRNRFRLAPTPKEGG